MDFNEGDEIVAVVHPLNCVWLCDFMNSRLPCPSPFPRICWNSCPLGWWCNPIISSSVAPFPSCRQSFPISGSFSMSQFFPSGGQSVGASASPSVLLMDIQGCISFRIDWFDEVAQFSSVQWLSHVRLFATPWIAARQGSLSITNSQSSLRLRELPYNPAIPLLGIHT